MARVHKNPGRIQCGQARVFPYECQLVPTTGGDARPEVAMVGRPVARTGILPLIECYSTVSVEVVKGCSR
jgi:hypothetical protein